MPSVHSGTETERKKSKWVREREPIVEQRKTKYNSDRERQGDTKKNNNKKTEIGEGTKGLVGFSWQSGVCGDYFWITTRYNAPQSQDVQPYKDEKISVYLQ